MGTRCVIPGEQSPCDARRRVPYLLKSPDGVLHRPGVVVTAVPFWSLAGTLRLGNGQLLRILAINTEIHHGLIEAGINGVFTVEPA
jgi:hypothetical protein